MKRLIYITYLSLLALLLFACEKENVLPAVANDEAELNLLRPGVACQSYSYQSKAGIVQLGTVRGDYAIVGFRPTLNSAQQLAILSNYSIFDVTDGDAIFDSEMGVVIKFKVGTTCKQVEKFITQLEKNPNVRYALPVFDDFLGGNYKWVSTSPEILVILNDPAHYNSLEKFARSTKTNIASSYDDVTFVLTVDKNSSGSVLELSSMLNASSKIATADPYYYGEFIGSNKYGRKQSEAKAFIKYQ